MRLINPIRAEKRRQHPNFRFRSSGCYQNVIWALLTAVLFSPVFVRGQELSYEPMLRIETGGHIAKLTELSADAANRFVVTASDDKTARVWDLSNGKLLKVLRPPIGSEKDGMLYAVAISPDGEQIAMAGWTGSGPDKNGSIYIFDRETGQMRTRIGGMEEVVFNLSYSPDGKYLAATLSGSYGLRVFETVRYSTVGADRNYDGPSEWVDFDATSTRLVTSSNDGFVRLYEISNDQLVLRTKRIISKGKEPIGVKFSPDGRLIAVGYYRVTGVSVISADDLSLKFDVDISRVRKGTTTNTTYFPVVSWSRDGRTVYAAGTHYNDNWDFLISSWTNDGQNYNEIHASRGAIYDIDSLSNGSIIYGVAFPAGWGMLDSNLRRTFLETSVIADFSPSKTRFLTNEDATSFQFSYRSMGELFKFSIRQRMIETAGKTLQGWRKSIFTSTKFQITNWDDGQRPKLNGVELPLDRNEKSHALTILPPSGNQFVLGTGWYLRLFDFTGKVIWRKSCPDAVRALNSDKEGKVVLAALSDGTVRWYRVSDGQEILAFFSPNDGSKKWIMWTPKGFYDSSADAEDLIGWHVNNGRDAAADFFPNHLFRDYFRRPDVIDRVLDTLDESAAFRIANDTADRKDVELTIAKVLPPVIIASSSEKVVLGETVSINYSIRSHSGETVTGIKAFVDGRQTPIINRTNADAKGKGSALIKVPNRDSELTLIASNRFTSSLPIRVRLKGSKRS